MSVPELQHRFDGSTNISEVVDQIIALAGDPEASHGEEDNLLEQLVLFYCPEPVVTEMNRLWAAGLTRWYA
jgi:hypothetical protein